MFFIVSSSNTLNPLKTGVRTIVIDAGHGGHDPGALGHGAREKDLALEIGIKLGRLLEDSLKDVRVVYTRRSDHFVELWERASIANKNNADLFISIHCNANNSTHAHGSETYIMGLHKSQGNLDVSKRENASILMEEDYKENEQYMGYDPNSPESHIILSLFQSAYREQSLQFAHKVQQNIQKNEILKNRGVKEAGFLVLWKTSMPSVLIETGFITNPNDKQFLHSTEGQQKMAHSIFHAVKDYKRSYEQAFED
jgi:N-acetylmuramoyl-L-alanine amidase